MRRLEAGGWRKAGADGKRLVEVTSGRSVYVDGGVWVMRRWKEADNGERS